MISPGMVIAGKYSVIAVVLALSISAHAEPIRGGIRLGRTDVPETTFLGGFGRLENLAGLQRFALESSIDFGVDDLGGRDVLAVQALLGVQYRIPLSEAWMGYPIVGASVAYYVRPDCPDGAVCDDLTTFGLNLGIGFEYGAIGVRILIGTDKPERSIAGTYTF